MQHSKRKGAWLLFSASEGQGEAEKGISHQLEQKRWYSHAAQLAAIAAPLGCIAQALTPSSPCRLGCLPLPSKSTWVAV